LLRLKISHYPHNINLYNKDQSEYIIMETNDLEYEENIARLLGKMKTFFDQAGLTELSKKSERILKDYNNSKNFM